MNKPVVIIGMGEMGGVFARGFLKAGYPVYPVMREVSAKEVAGNLDVIETVVVAVGEKALDETLENIPAKWRDKLILLQNELLPADWEKHHVSPTVISVWFEKKKPMDYKVIIPSPVFGPQAGLVEEALGAIDIPVKRCSTEDELLGELIVKNLYILTTNIAGLKAGGNVRELWDDHRDLARSVAGEVLDIQFKLAGRELSRDKLIEAMVKAFEGDPDHKCMGRSAPARLARALQQADDAGLEAATLRDIAQQCAAG